MPKLGFSYKEEEKDETMRYDIAMWHTLLRYVYGTKDLHEYQGMSANAYIEKLKPMYDLSFLDEDRKCQKVISNLKRIDADIMFFQEYAKVFQQAVSKLDEYYVSCDMTKDTMIIAKKKTFKKKPENNDVVFEQFLGKELKDQLNWCDRTAIMIVDKLVLLNAHLSSKADKNKEQV